MNICLFFTLLKVFLCAIERITTYGGVLQVKAYRTGGRAPACMYSKLSFPKFKHNDNSMPSEYDGILDQTCSMIRGTYRIDHQDMWSWITALIRDSNNLILSCDLLKDDISPKPYNFQVTFNCFKYDKHGVVLCSNNALFYKSQMYSLYETEIKNNLAGIEEILTQENLAEMFNDKYNNDAIWYHFEDFKECYEFFKSYLTTMIDYSGESFINLCIQLKIIKANCSEIKKTNLLLSDLYNFILAVKSLDNEEKVNFVKLSMLENVEVEYKRGKLFRFTVDKKAVDGLISNDYCVKAFNNSGIEFDIRDLYYIKFDKEIFVPFEELEKNHIVSLRLVKKNKKGPVPQVCTFERMYSGKQ